MRPYARSHHAGDRARRRHADYQGGQCFSFASRGGSVGFPSLAPHYQIILSRNGVLDVMTVEVETAPEARIASSDRPAMAKKVSSHIKSLIGVTCDVAIESPRPAASVYTSMVAALYDVLHMSRRRLSG